MFFLGSSQGIAVNSPYNKVEKFDGVRAAGYLPFVITLPGSGAEGTPRSQMGVFMEVCIV